LYETSSVLRKATETEISGLTFWLRFGSIRVFKNRNQTEIQFPHIPNNDIVSYTVTWNIFTKFELFLQCVSAFDGLVTLTFWP